MSLHRRKLMRLAVGIIALPAVPRIVAAQTYPARPVHLVAGFAAGGPTDVAARMIGQWLSERVGQPFLVENRPGAGGNLATESVVGAAPDGYTLLLAASANAINAAVYAKLKFNFIEDIAPVAAIMRQPFVMVTNPAVPAATVPDFIAYARSNPGKVAMASAGNGTPHHAMGELFKIMTGLTLVHVPYLGEAPALTDLLGGQVQMMFASVSGTIGYLRAGTLRGLAVTTATRAQMLPDVATVGDFVHGFDASAWLGIGAPKGTSGDIIKRLNSEINRGLAEPKIVARLSDFGGMALPGSPDEFKQLIADDTRKWAKVVSLAGIKVD